MIGGFGSLTSQPIDAANWPDLFRPAELILWLPGVAFALVMFFGMRLFKNLLALPGLILASIAVFYAVLFATGTPLAEASRLGLLLGDLGSRPMLALPIPSGFAGVDWRAMLAQSGQIGVVVLLNLVSMLLNVSGIELILDKEIDLNRELKSAGGANLLAGLTGGLSGYHTPTLTALNKRLAGETRLAALVGGGLCGLALIAGAGFLPFVPKMILGGLLLFLGLDFMNEWVFEGWRKLNPVDYLVVVVIMLVIAFAGFLTGVGLGLLAMVTIFAVRYSRIGVLRSSETGAEVHSNVERPAAERKALEDRNRQIFVMELNGYVFFGTAYKLQRTLKDRMADPQSPAPRFVILDFSRVSGLDSSGVQVFRKMEAMAGLAGFTLIFSGLSDALRRPLGPASKAKQLPSLDLALEWCEEQLLAEILGPQRTYTLRDYLTGAGLDLEISLALIIFFRELKFEPGQTLIRAGEEAHELYFIQEGRVATYLESRAGDPFRVSVMGPGTIVGEIGLYLGHSRTASVVAEDATTACCLTDEALRRMKTQKPKLAAAFDEFMIHVLAERVIIASRRLSSV